MTKMANNPVRFRLREHNDSVDPETGIVTDENGQQWGTVDALRKLAAKLEAERDKEADKLFVPAQRERISSEPTPEGGTLDVMADGFWAKRNRKDTK